MKRKIQIGIAAVLLLVIIAAITLYVNLNGIIRSRIETQTAQSLQVETTLSGAALSIFGGKLTLSELELGSPTGYQAPRMFRFENAEVMVDYGQLTSDPVHVREVVINEPRLVIEQIDGQFNFNALMDSGGEAPPEPAGEPLRVVIETLRINNATIVVRPGLPGIDEIPVSVPSLQLNNIGTGGAGENGAAMKDVVMQVVVALAGEAANVGNLGELTAEYRRQLESQVDEVTEQFSAEIREQIQDITDRLPSQVGDVLRDREIDPGEAIDRGVRDLLRRDRDSGNEQ